MGGSPMMYYRPMPMAAWHKEGDWHVLRDGGDPLARFQGKVWEVRSGGEWIGLAVSTQGFIAEFNGWVKISGTDNAEVSHDLLQFRFWSNGRWITVW